MGESNRDLSAFLQALLFSAEGEKPGVDQPQLQPLATRLEALSAAGAAISQRAYARSEHARVLRAVDAKQALANALMALEEACSISADEPESLRARTVAACEATVAICCQTVGDDPSALEHARSGLRALGDLKDDLTRFRLYNAQAVVYNNFAQADRALESYARAREAAEQLQDATPLSVLNTNIACVYLEILDQPDRAIPYLDRALAIDGAEPIARVWALQALGLAENRLGEHEGALEHADEAEGIAELHGLLSSVSASLLVAGDALRGLGRGEDSRAALKRSVDVARRAGAGDMLADSLTALGECEAAAGHSDAARAALEEAVDLTGHRNPARHPLPALAGLAAQADDHVSAYAYLTRFLEIVQRSADARSRMASSALEVEHSVATVRQEAEFARREQCRLREEAEILEQRVRKRTAELEDSQTEMIERLAATEHRHHESVEHTLRVGDLARALAQELRLDDPFIDDIAVAARLHDIGIIAVHDAILRKPGPLTAEEYEEMKAHTLLGAGILSNGRTGVMRLAEEIARSHHERWDGAGYPYGMAALSIPMSGRIVAACDAFDVMLSPNVYRPAKQLPEVIAEIRGAAGTQFDPRVARAIVSLVDSGPDFIARLYGTPGAHGKAA